MSLITRSESPVGFDPRSRHLPATVPNGFVVGSDEPVAPALRRVTTEQFTVAIDALTDPGADLELAAVVSRRSLWRVAAVLRLVRGSVGSEVYRSETVVLREVDKGLGALLTNDGALRALDELRNRYASVLRPDALVRVRDDLVRDQQLRRLRAFAEHEVGGETEQTLLRLRRARARFAAWGAGDRATAEPPTLDSFEAFTEGLERTYRRGRRRWKSAAAGEDPNPRRWERDVRDLGDQLELLAASWPEVIGAAVAGCTDLAATLSEEMGCSALRRSVGNDARPLDDAERSLLTALCDHTRSELHRISVALGARIYAETPSAFVTRIGSYWATRR